MTIGRWKWLAILAAVVCPMPAGAQDSVPSAYAGEVRPISRPVTLRYAPVSDARMHLTRSGSVHRFDRVETSTETATLLWTTLAVPSSTRREQLAFDLRLVALNENESGAPLAQVVMQGPPTGDIQAIATSFVADEPAGSQLAVYMTSLLQQRVIPYLRPIRAVGASPYHDSNLVPVLGQLAGVRVFDYLTTQGPKSGGAFATGLTSLRGRESLLISIDTYVVRWQPVTRTNRWPRKVDSDLRALGYQVIDLETGLVAESYIQMIQSGVWRDMHIDIGTVRTDFLGQNPDR